MKKQLLYLLICILYVVMPASAKSSTTIEGKWQLYDISIAIEGLPSVIATAIAQQIKTDPSSECVRNSVLEIGKAGAYTITNACEENEDFSGTWLLAGNKLTFTVDNQSVRETVTITEITAEAMSVDISSAIPSDFELDGIKLTSVILVLKRK